MADLALGGLDRILRACLAIKSAVETVQQNKKGCRDVQTCVDRVTALLSWLKELTMGAMMHHPSFTRPLDDLAESMEAALQLITDCQQKNALRHLWGAGSLAKQLRRVQEDIQNKMVTVILATSILNLEISVSVTKTLHYVGAHPPLLQPQVAEEVNSYDSNLSAIERRPGVNSNTTMVATGNTVLYASSPTGLTESNSSKWESALHLFSEENISEGGHAFIMKQKIVIKVAMPSDKSRSKAMAVVAAAAGVDTVAIYGEGRDSVVVEGYGVDSIKLTAKLRKKLGDAQLVEVGPPSRSNGELPATQRFSDPSTGSSCDAEESPSSSQRPASFMGNGKQTLRVAQPHHPEVRPHVAAPALPDDGSSLRGIMARLRAAAARLPAVHEWLVVPIMSAYRIIFVFVFLLFLRIVTSSNF